MTTWYVPGVTESAYAQPSLSVLVGWDCRACAPPDSGVTVTEAPAVPVTPSAPQSWIAIEPVDASLMRPSGARMLSVRTALLVVSIPAHVTETPTRL